MYAACPYVHILGRGTDPILDVTLEAETFP
jgi:hypothetical protein